MDALWRTELGRLRKIVFDSNALIYAIELRVPYYPRVLEALHRIVMGSAVGVISTVVEMELLSKPIESREMDFDERIEIILQNMPLSIRAVDSAIARRAAVLRAHDRRWGSIDAIIAATAIEEQADAIIGNDASFRLRAPVPYLYLSDYVS